MGNVIVNFQFITPVRIEKIEKTRSKVEKKKEIGIKKRKTVTRKEKRKAKYQDIPVLESKNKNGSNQERKRRKSCMYGSSIMRLEYILRTGPSGYRTKGQARFSSYIGQARN
jgi:uncharacterized membrane protein YgaE (UPF0421/DUF939 family)